MKDHPTIPGLCIDAKGVMFFRLHQFPDENGYLHVTLRDGSQELTHRLLWEIYNNQLIPDGLMVRHLNDIKNDNREENLALGTHQDNMRDRTRNGGDLKGEDHGNSKLTEEAVKEIRRRASLGERPRTIAKEYGIALTTCREIISRKTWKHVKE